MRDRHCNCCLFFWIVNLQKVNFLLRISPTFSSILLRHFLFEYSPSFPSAFIADIRIDNFTRTNLCKTYTNLFAFKILLISLGIGNSFQICIALYTAPAFVVCIFDRNLFITIPTLNILIIGFIWANLNYLKVLTIFWRQIFWADFNLDKSLHLFISPMNLVFWVSHNLFKAYLFLLDPFVSWSMFFRHTLLKVSVRFVINLNVCKFCWVLFWLWENTCHKLKLLLSLSFNLLTNLRASQSFFYFPWNWSRTRVSKGALHRLLNKSDRVLSNIRALSCLSLFSNKSERILVIIIEIFLFAVTLTFLK